MTTTGIDLDPLLYAEDSTIDAVDRIYGSGHYLYCNYVAEYSESGLVYCRTCGSQIGNLRGSNTDADNYQVLRRPARKYFLNIL